MKRAIHWFRRDLHVSGNTALSEACKQADELILVYILSTWKKSHLWTGANRQKFSVVVWFRCRMNLNALGE